MKGLVLLIFWMSYLVSANICPHPTFMVPEKVNSILKIKQFFKIATSCTVEDKRYGSKQNGTIKFTSENIICIGYNWEFHIPSNPDFNETTLLHNGTFTVKVIQKEVRISEDEYRIMIPRNILKTKDVYVYVPSVEIYKLSDPPIKYGVITNKVNWCLNLRILDEVLPKKDNMLFWNTDMDHVQIALNYSNKRLKTNLEETVKVSTPTQVAFYQMWLECKFQTSVIEKKCLSESISEPYLYIMGFFVLWVTMWYLIGVSINFFTLKKLKSFKRKNDKYMLCCVNQAMTLSTVCNAFLPEKDLLEEQLSWIVTTLYCGDRKVIVVSKDQNKRDSKSDYSRLSEYFSAKDMSERPVVVKTENIYENVSMTHSSTEALQ